MSPGDVQATCCAALVDELIAHGVRQAVVAPGSRSTPVALALLDRPELAVHVVHDERVAAFVALGAGLDGVPAVLLCTSGTAAANFHPAVVEAGLADCPDDRHHRRPAHRSCVTSVPHRRSTRPTSTAGRSAGSTTRACPTRSPPRRGARSAPERSSPRPPGRSTSTCRSASRSSARPGALPPRRRTALSTAGTTVAEADGGVWSTCCADRAASCSPGRVPGAADLARFVAATGWPLLADPVSGCRDVPGAIAVADALLRHPGFASERPDVIVRVGRPATSKVLAQWVAASGAPVLQVGGPGRHRSRPPHRRPGRCQFASPGWPRRSPAWATRPGRRDGRRPPLAPRTPSTGPSARRRR